MKKELQGIAEQLHVMAQCDHAIAKHIDALRNLKSRYNDLAYISRLPPEILGKIFLHYKDHICITMKDKEPSSEKYPAWVTLAHVCRLWRVVSLDSPKLWSFISMHWSKNFIQKSVIRSKQYPLEIVAAILPNAHTESILEALIPRAATLQVIIRDPPFRNAWMNPKSAPLLKTLSFDIRGHRFVPSHVEKLPLAHILCGNAAPALQVLDIASTAAISLRQFSTVHSNLTSLCIRNPIRVYDGHGRADSVDDIIEALEMMPLLENLSLFHYLPVQFSHVRMRPVLLNHLRSITIADNSRYCGDFLLYLNVPCDASVRLLGNSPNAPDVFQQLKKRLLGGSSSLIFSIMRGGEVFRFAPIRTSSDMRADELKTFGRSRNQPELVIATDKWEDLLSLLAEGSVLPEILELNLSLEPDYPRNSRFPLKSLFIQGFAQLSRLQILVLYGDDTVLRLLMSILGIGTSDRIQAKGDDPVQGLWPELRELSLDSVTIPNKLGLHLQSRHVLEQLMVWLRSRRMNGLGPAVLKISADNTERQDVESYYRGCEWAEFGITLVLDLKS